MAFKYGIFLFLLVLLSGCDKLENLNQPPKQVIIQTKSSEHIEEIERILFERFSEHKVSIFSRIESYIDGDTIIFTFKWDSPSKGVIDYLVNHKGNLVVRANVGYIWFNSKDIKHSSVERHEDRNYLQFAVHDAVVPKIKRISRKNIGKDVRMELDGELISVATIRGELGKWFQVDIDKKHEELLLISTLVRTGPLPGEVIMIKSEI